MKFECIIISNVFKLLSKIRLQVTFCLCNNTVEKTIIIPIRFFKDYKRQKFKKVKEEHKFCTQILKNIVV